MDFIFGTVAKIDRIDLARKAEDLGYSHFGVAEGPLLFSEPYQYLALGAQETSTIRLGTWVTNPLTRLPPQTANAIATLNALAPGRTFLGFGAANNAMRSMGMRPARIAEIEGAVRVIRGMLSGERVPYRWDDRERDVQFLDPAGGWYNIGDPVPIYMAAGGERSLDLAGRIADGVIYALGADLPLVRLVRRLIDDAAARSGRPAGSVKLIASTFFYLLRPGEGLHEAVTKGFGSGPLVAALLNRDLMRRHRDDLNEEVVREADRGGTVYTGAVQEGEVQHLDAWRQYLKGLDPRHVPYITKPIVDAFCIWGDPDECLAQARSIADAGVDAINVFLSNPETYDRDMEDFAAAVIRRW